MEYSKRHLAILNLLLGYTFLMIAVYVCLRVFLLWYIPMDWRARLFSSTFLIAELFFFLQAFGYFRYLRTVYKKRMDGPSRDLDNLALVDYPPVAIVVASYKEPLDVLEDTLICFHNLSYPNKHLYFLDDTRYDKMWDTPEKMLLYKLAVESLCRSLEINLFRRKWHHAKAGMINDFLEYVEGARKEDFVMTKNDRKPQHEKEKYIIVFDADMNPLPNFVEPLVAMMEARPDVAFVQTPQYYTNFKRNLVARAASLMQVVFYEWICEAKGIQNLMIFCGTNVILRMKALQDVGGIDLSSVTEDFATAFKLHQKDWKSLYVNKVSAFGMGPEDLGSFFKQQHRWALGTVGMLPKLLFSFVRHPFRYPFRFWWEYLMSSSYYLVGWMYFILLLGPVFYVFFDFRSYIFPPVIYVLMVVPYILVMNTLFYWTLCERGYKFKDLFLGMVLGMLAIPVYMKASAMALLGIKGQFVVTPKGEANALPLRDLWPQISLCLLCFVTLVWGSLRLIYEDVSISGLAINMFWVTYYFILFSTIFYFNRSEETAKEKLAVA